MQPNNKLMQSELTRNLSAGDISALDWIDCNGSDEDEINVEHFGAYDGGVRSAESRTYSPLGEDVGITATADRERGDGDSGEEICAISEHPSYRHSPPINDTETYMLNYNEPPVGCLLKSKNFPPGTNVPGKCVPDELHTIMEQGLSDDGHSSPKTYTISHNDNAEELHTIMSGISSLELDDDEFDNMTNSDKEISDLQNNIENERNVKIESCSTVDEKNFIAQMENTREVRLKIDIPEIEPRICKDSKETNQSTPHKELLSGSGISRDNSNRFSLEANNAEIPNLCDNIKSTTYIMSTTDIGKSNINARSAIEMSTLKETLLQALLSIAVGVTTERPERCTCDNFQSNKSLDCKWSTSASHHSEKDKLAITELVALIRQILPQSVTTSDEMLDIFRDLHGIDADALLGSSSVESSLSPRAPMAVAEEDADDNDDAAAELNSLEVFTLEERILEAPAAFRGTNDEITDDKLQFLIKDCDDDMSAIAPALDDEKPTTTRALQFIDAENSTNVEDTHPDNTYHNKNDPAVMHAIKATPNESNLILCLLNMERYGCTDLMNKQDEGVNKTNTPQTSWRMKESGHITRSSPIGGIGTSSDVVDLSCVLSMELQNADINNQQQMRDNTFKRHVKNTAQIGTSQSLNGNPINSMQYKETSCPPRLDEFLDNQINTLDDLLPLQGQYVLGAVDLNSQKHSSIVGGCRNFFDGEVNESTEDMNKTKVQNNSISLAQTGDLNKLMDSVNHDNANERLKDLNMNEPRLSPDIDTDNKYNSVGERAPSRPNNAANDSLEYIDNHDMDLMSVNTVKNVDSSITIGAHTKGVVIERLGSLAEDGRECSNAAINARQSARPAAGGVGGGTGGYFDGDTISACKGSVAANRDRNNAAAPEAGSVAAAAAAAAAGQGAPTPDSRINAATQVKPKKQEPNPAPNDGRYQADANNTSDGRSPNHTTDHPPLQSAANCAHQIPATTNAGVTDATQIAAVDLNGVTQSMKSTQCSSFIQEGVLPSPPTSPPPQLGDRPIFIIPSRVEPETGIQTSYVIRRHASTGIDNNDVDRGDTEKINNPDKQACFIPCTRLIATGGGTSEDNDQIETQPNASVQHNLSPTPQQSNVHVADGGPSTGIAALCEKCGFGRKSDRVLQQQYASTTTRRNVSLKQLERFNFEDYSEIKRSLQRLIEASFAGTMDVRVPHIQVDSLFCDLDGVASRDYVATDNCNNDATLDNADNIRTCDAGSGNNRDKVLVVSNDSAVLCGRQDDPVSECNLNTVSERTVKKTGSGAASTADEICGLECFGLSPDTAARSAVILCTRDDATLPGQILCDANEQHSSLRDQCRQDAIAVHQRPCNTDANTLIHSELLTTRSPSDLSQPNLDVNTIETHASVNLNQCSSDLNDNPVISQQNKLSQLHCVSDTDKINHDNISLDILKKHKPATRICNELISGREISIGTNSGVCGSETTLVKSARDDGGPYIVEPLDKCGNSESIFGKSTCGVWSEHGTVVASGSAVAVQTSIDGGVPATGAQAHTLVTAAATPDATSRPHVRRVASNTHQREQAPGIPALHPNATVCQEGGPKAPAPSHTETENNNRPHQKRRPSVNSNTSVDVNNSGDKVNYIWEFSNGRLVFKKLDKVAEPSERRNETESDYSDGHSSRLLSGDGAHADRISDSQSADIETHTLFDVIERYADRIESEIAKCSTESSNLINLKISRDLSGDVLSSRDLNKGTFEGRSRLKRLESKLKEAAGVLDAPDTNRASEKLENTPKTQSFVLREKDEISPTVELPNKHNENSDANANIVTNSCGIDLKQNPNLSIGQDDTQVKQVVDKSACRVLGDSEENTVTKKLNASELGNSVVDTKNVEAGGNSNYSSCCEFDVNKVGDFGSYSDSDFYVVYDELEDDIDNDGSEEMVSSSSYCEEEHYHLINCTSLTAPTMRGEAAMGTEVGSGEHRKRHNPDHDNLKSLLKKPTRGRGGDGKKNRVVFNEKRNEFFDADYIILIREECDYDEEDDDGVCTCNQHEMVRLTCCEPNCNCNYESAGYEQTPPSPKFAPPLEFVDAVTLSPPEGYKDMDLGELAALQLLTRQRAAQMGAVCRDCSSAQHQQHLSDDSDSPHSENEEEDPVGGCAESGSYAQQHPQQERPTGEISKTDQSQQTTPTTPTTPLSEDAQQRYIMETITMTTVTERRIMREADGGEETPAPAGDVSAADDVGGSGSDDPPPARPTALPPPGGSPISGILKGGRLWKQQQQQLHQQQHAPASAPTAPVDVVKTVAPDRPQIIETTFSADSDEVTNKRSVRFCESDDETRNSCDGESEHQHTNEQDSANQAQQTDEATLDNQKDHETDSCNNSISPDGTEMMLTFKLGNHLLMSNNSLRPNSAVRQLFPCTNTLVTGSKDDVDSGQQYIVTSESLRAFEEAKRSKLPQLGCDASDDSSIRRTIERNTLRRSLIRYEPRAKKTPPKTDNSLVERIKQLTCDVDENPPPEPEQPPCSDDIPARTSPPGEEARKSPEVNPLNNKNIDKNSFSPSSSSTTSSNSSMSSTYKKITDLFAKKQDKTHAQAETQTMTDVNNRHNIQAVAPDLGNGGSKPANPDFIEPQCAVSKYNVTHEARKQFLSTLAPLTACVSGAGVHDEYYYQLSSHGCERASVASTVGTEYSLEDIDAVLQTEGSEEPKRVAPDVLVGTPSASESGDELAMFVQQDASRIERIKKRYQPENNTNEEDDEHDDYGFNRRPSVRGIKPRFGSTNEIIQQIQSQMQHPAQPSQQPPPPQRPASQIAWPYYSEASLSTVDNKNSRTAQTMTSRLSKEDSGSEYSLQNQTMSPDPKYSTYSQPYHYVQDNRAYRAPPYRPNSLVEENIYQNCTNQRCTQQHYTINPHNAPVMRIGGGCSELYQTLPTRRASGRPESPPPMELARNYHQTMVLIPYNHIEGYHASSLSPNPHYAASDSGTYVRTAPKTKPPQPPHIIRQSPDPSVNYQCNTNSLLKVGQKQMIRVPYSSGQPVQVHLMASRSESPQLPGQFATARATQTPAAVMSTANYYQPAPTSRYRPAIGPTNSNIWVNQDPYATKVVRLSGTYATTGRPTSEAIDPQVNGFRVAEGHYSVPRDSAPASPTKSRFTSERGVPEGAASVSPQDSYQGPSTANSAISPTTPQNPTQGNSKPMYYAMNV